MMVCRRVKKKRRLSMVETRINIRRLIHISKMLIPERGKGAVQATSLPWHFPEPELQQGILLRQLGLPGLSFGGGKIKLGGGFPEDMIRFKHLPMLELFGGEIISIPQGHQGPSGPGGSMAVVTNQILHS